MLCAYACASGKPGGADPPAVPAGQEGAGPSDGGNALPPPGGTATDGTATDGGEPDGTSNAVPGMPVPEPIDGAGREVLAISSDERLVLFSRKPNQFKPGTGDLFVTERGGATTQIEADGVWYGDFTSDGTSIVYRTFAHDAIELVRTDGTGRRQLSSGGTFAIAGRWVYFTDLVDGQTELWRVLPPDGTPELISNGPGSVDFAISRDGEMVSVSLAYGPAPRTYSLIPAGSSKPIPLAGPAEFSPDGNWFLSACDLYDRTGRVVRHICDNLGGAAFSEDATKLAIVDDAATRVITLASMAESRLPRPPGGLDRLTPDGSCAIARAGGTTVDSFGLYVACTDGGDWMPLSNDVYSPRFLPDIPFGLAISPDSRVIATSSLSQGVVASIEGGPARVMTKDGKSLLFAPPIFEPAGGHDRAIFYERSAAPDQPRQAIGNADGSGNWIELPPQPGVLRWTGHSVLTWTRRGSDPSIVIFGDHPGLYDVFVTTDDGAMTAAPLVTNVTPAFFDESPTHPALYFARAGGGLFRVAVPQPDP